MIVYYQNQDINIDKTPHSSQIPPVCCVCVCEFYTTLLYVQGCVPTTIVMLQTSATHLRDGHT